MPNFEKGDIVRHMDQPGSVTGGPVIDGVEQMPSPGMVWFTRHLDGHRYMCEQRQLSHARPEDLLKMYPKTSKKQRDLTLKRQLERHSHGISSS